MRARSSNPGNRFFLLANGEPIFQCLKGGILYDRIDILRKWRRRTDGPLRDLLLRWNLPFEHLTKEQLAAPVDTVVFYTFNGPLPVAREEVVL